MTTKDNALRMAIEAMELEGIGGCDAANACKAALSDAVTLPDGWVAVPVEPTDEMKEEGWLAYRDSNKPAPYNMLTDSYKAMLQAAPTCEKEKG